MLVDLNLRGEDGLALIERLHDAFPEVAIIAISDELSRHRELSNLKARGAAVVLPKPITPEWKTLAEQFGAMRRKLGLRATLSGYANRFPLLHG
jgi:CheY-like chemotaxis protein